MIVHEVIRAPLVTEKAAMLKDEHRTVCFRVAVNANKTEIKGAVEKLFGVKVQSVRTVRNERQVETIRSLRRQTTGLEESFRYLARGRKNDRVLRGGLDDGNQEI